MSSIHATHVAAAPTGAERMAAGAALGSVALSQCGWMGVVALSTTASIAALAARMSGRTGTDRGAART